MTNHPIPTEMLCKQAYDAIEKYGSGAEAARRLSVSPRTITERARKYKERWLGKTGGGDSAPVLPEFPEDDIPVEEIIESMCKRYEKRSAHVAAKKWFPVQIKSDIPIGVGFVGDPHVDDDGCNWPLLKQHIEIFKNTDGLYGVNIGDTTNNWVGRLMKKFADQETSQSTARKLAKWFLHDSGIEWLVWLLGNHDVWNDGAAVLTGMNTKRIPMEDWEAKFRLVFPNNRECRIWASHNFSGNSIWNSLHGPQRTAHTKAEANIYVCGHLHNWALHHEESATRDFTYWLARARGYKFIDEYATKLGHGSQDEGATIVSVIDPKATSEAGFVTCFADMEEGADFLTWKRSKA